MYRGPRDLWVRLETIHAVTYFGVETSDAATEAGLPSWWMGYFGFRSAPLGRVSNGVIDAAFHSFSPSFVQRWVPEVWSYASPEDLLRRRSAAAAATLTRVGSTAEHVARQSIPVLEGVVAVADWSGRPMFAANLLVELPHEPVARLWQLCTTLREHRGDGHVAACVAAGLSGLEAHVLIAIHQNNSFEDLQRTRGWTGEQWSRAMDGLQRRGLLGPDGLLTGAGHDCRTSVEDVTDRLAAAAFELLGPSMVYDLCEILQPLALDVAMSGTIRYPNPMGLPKL